MSSTNPAHSEGAVGTPPLAMKLEVVVIPVSDIERAKRFYAGLGWRLDADFAVGDTFRVVQFTPPGSPSSVHFGTGVTSAIPGSRKGFFSSCRTSRQRAPSSSIMVRTWARYFTVLDRAYRWSTVGTRSGAATSRTPPSAIQRATAGCCKRSSRDSPDASTPTRRHFPRRPS